MNTLIAFWVFILGLCVGSFLNVVIIRGLRKEQIIKGSSHCNNCDYTLKWYDNIPVISYILLKGKCRNCGEKISIQYPIIEIITGISSLWIYLVNGNTIKTVLYILVIFCMIVISMVDLKIQEIPILLVYIIGIVAIINTILNKSYKDSILGFVAIPVFLLIILLLTSGRGIGGGDIKLEAVLGLLLTWKYSILSFYIGCVSLVIAYPILRKLKIKGFDTNKVPFGPYLCFGAFIMMIYGEQIVSFVTRFMFGV